MKSREGKLKRVGAVMSFFAVGCTSFSVSCTGLDRHLGSTINPFGNPNMPDARSETAQRVRGVKLSTMPVLPEEGDVWPGQPEPVPSLQDVSRSDRNFVEKWQKARPQLDADLRQQLNDGQGMSVGEDVGQRYGSGKGVMPIGKPIPSHVKDNARPYMEPAGRGVVTIPNGDGTDTLIAPDGSVKVVSAGKASLYAHARTFGHVHSSEESRQEAQAELQKAPPAEPLSHLERRAGGGAVSRQPANREPTITEAPRPQPRVEVLPEPQRPVRQAPAVTEAPRPQPRVEVPPEPQRPVRQVPAVTEVPRPQPRVEVPSEPQRPVRQVPAVTEAPRPQPETGVVAAPLPQQSGADEEMGRQHRSKGKAGAHHRHEAAVVDAAQPVVEPHRTHRHKHTQARQHEVVVIEREHHTVAGRHVEAHAQKERHHSSRKRDDDYVDALGFEAPARSHRSHKSERVYQFDWDK
ncbi:hypothetical protein SACS_1269 [Parasaccharibacter apium]|uniref:Uncharacterized protein n=2 Tax=Parasaccharibacter apium TaxID=1510841 RepID=A0A7U7G6D4_9PROT|nr:hypothetical protein SACS_1269 [Parasaccharibacter apium]